MVLSSIGGFQPATPAFGTLRASTDRKPVYFGEEAAEISAAVTPPESRKTDPANAMAQQVRRAYDLLGWWLDKQFLPGTPLNQTEFTVLDIETQGFGRSKKDVGIIEVAALKYRDGMEVARFSTLVKPQGAIPEEIQKLTGITQAMADNGIDPKQALEALAQFVGPYATLVAHNAVFDLPFIRSKLHQNGLDEWMSRFDLKRAICPQTLARVALPALFDYPVSGKGLYKAETLASYFGLTNPSAHRAEDDTRTTALTLYKLIDALQSNKDKTGHAMDTLRDLFAYQGPAVTIGAKPIPDAKFDPAPLIAKAREVLGGCQNSSRPAKTSKPASPDSDQNP